MILSSLAWVLAACSNSSASDARARSSPNVRSTALAVQEFHDPAHFSLVLGVRAAGIAGRKAHLHFRIYATWVGRIGLELRTQRRILKKSKNSAAKCSAATSDGKGP